MIFLDCYFGDNAKEIAKYAQAKKTQKLNVLKHFRKISVSFYFLILFNTFWLYLVPSEAGIACLSNPCLYGLCVDDVNSSYSCYCADGYTGSNCQTDWDECWSQPCFNGGECFDLVASYNCSCLEGFSGPSCEFDRDECLSQPCLNNGTCVDGSNGFECHCLPGYIGSVCEWDVSVCNATGSERCLHGGACMEGPGDRFWCVCAPGWGGTLCEEPLDPCLLFQPCQHGGLCLSRNDDFICACPFGYTGARCEQELALCRHNPCLNDAICVEESDESVCYCVPDFHGDLCQLQYDECLLPPTPSCKNGGTCIDGVDGFSCSCPPDVTGKYCECPVGYDCSNHTHFPELPSLSPGPFPTYTPTQKSPFFKTTSLSVHSDVSSVFKMSTESIITTLSSQSTKSEISDASVFSVSTPVTTDINFSKDEDKVSPTSKFHLTSEQTFVTSSIFDHDQKIPMTQAQETSIIGPHTIPTSEFTTEMSVSQEKYTTEIPLLTLPKQATQGSMDSISSTVGDYVEGTSSSLSTQQATQSSADSSKKSYEITSQGSHIPISVSTDPVDISKTTVAVDSNVTKLFEYLSSITSKYDATSLPDMEVTTSFPMKTSSEISFSGMYPITTIAHESTTFKDKEQIPVEIHSTAAPTSKFSDIDVTPITHFVTLENGLTSSSSDRLSSAVTVPSLPEDLSTTLKAETQDQSSSLPHDPSFHGFTSLASSTESFVSMRTVDDVGGEMPFQKSSETSKQFTTSATQESFHNGSTVDSIGKEVSKHSSESSGSETDKTTSASVDSSMFGIDVYSSTTVYYLPDVRGSTKIPQIISSEKDVITMHSTKTTLRRDPTTSTVPSGVSLQEVSTSQQEIISQVPVSIDSSLFTTPLSQFTSGPTDVDYDTSIGPSTIDSLEPTSCEGKSPCLNGGTCVMYTSGFQCRCPLQFSGVTCENISNMTEVSLLPSSWLLFRVVTPAEGTGLAFTHKLEATLRIVSEEGVVFTLAEAEEGRISGYHMQMSIFRGRLRLQFSCGLQSVRFSESKQRIDTGYATKISATLSVWSGNESVPQVGRCRAELRLNHSLAVSGEQLRPLSAPHHVALAHLVFGAWPRVRAPTSSNSKPDTEDDGGVGPAAPGVVACISGVRINARPRLLLGGVTAGTNDVVQCEQLACLSSPCINGGICEETLAGSWSCRCPSGRLGARCELSVCANSPCEGGGTCLVHPGTNFVCLCPLGRQGIFCEQELEVTKPCLAPALVGVSPYLAVPLAPRHASFRHGLELGLRFTATRTHQVAVLAYMGHGPRDHMAVSYVHGRIMLTWDLGSGPRRIFTAREFVAGFEQEVRVGRSGKEGWLRVKGDNGTHLGSSSGKMTQLNTKPILYIGGLKRGNTSLLPHDLPKHAGFEGCLSNIEIKTGSNQVTKYFPPGPPINPMRGRAVNQQNLQVCASNPCQNRGICLPHGPSFTCLCSQGWFGPLCAEPRNPCDSQSNLCAEGSTCVPLLRGYECDCPLGRTGTFCRTVETRGSVVWPEVHFVGRRSYLEVGRTSGGSDPGGLEHSCVEFEMRPITTPNRDPAAQVLFFSRDPDTRDYMALLLTQDRNLQFLLGSGDGAPLILKSPRGALVRPGAWVRVRAGRIGRRVFLSVAGRPISNWLLPGQAGDWSGAGAPLYIGGAPDLSLVAPLTWSLVRPFTGCVRRLHVDWRKVLVRLGPRTSRASSQAPEEPISAQLTPEYMKQVQLSENWSATRLGDDLSSFLQHESLAAYVSGQRESIQNWNTKAANGMNDFKYKYDNNKKSVYSIMKQSTLPPTQTLQHEINETDFDDNDTMLKKVVTLLSRNLRSTKAPTLVDQIPSLMSRSLRTRDALFAVAARNVRPCEKSSPAMLQSEPCVDEERQDDDCKSLQYQAHSSNLASVPGFNGNGWLLIHVPTVLMSTEPESLSAPFTFLSLRFSATQPNGIIAWAEQEKAGYVGVGLQKGRLRVVWGDGHAHSSTALLSSSLADGVFHSVSVLWDCETQNEKDKKPKEAHVWVDGEPWEVEQERASRQKRQHEPSFKTHDATITIFLGGFPGSGAVSEVTKGHFNSSLHGCVSELAWDDETAILSEYTSYPHHNLIPCKPN